MLHEFLTSNRAELIERCKRKVAKRNAPRAHGELNHGVPIFLDQLIKTLRVQQRSSRPQGHEETGPAGREGAGNGASEPGDADLAEVRVTATMHGRELLQGGYTIDQVVHDYGDLCQAITDLAVEKNAQIEVGEFRTLNRCLDNGIADAVTAYSTEQTYATDSTGAQALNERLGFLAHELRNHINTATLAASAIKGGGVGSTGATGAVLDRSLIALRELVDRSLADARSTAGMPPRHEVVSLVDLVETIRISARLEALAHNCKFAVAKVETGLQINADRGMILAAIGNLLQNAFKFTQRGTEVRLTVHAESERILIDVEDHCGGLPPSPEKLFLPFQQGSGDVSNVGQGLAICRRSVEANKGILRVRDVPGSGCVFTVDLPRHLKDTAQSRG